MGSIPAESIKKGFQMDRSFQRTVPLGDNGINHKLHTMRNDPQTFWSATANSFVLVHDSQFTDGRRSAKWLHPFLGRVALYSINGAGEIRWDVAPMKEKKFQALEDREAIDYFGLIPVAGWEE